MLIMDSRVLRAETERQWIGARDPGGLLQVTVKGWSEIWCDSGPI